MAWTHTITYGQLFHQPNKFSRFDSISVYEEITIATNGAP